MNCCSDYGQCTRGADCPARARTCDQLGVCQDRTPRCKGCKPGPLEVLSSEKARDVTTAVVLGLSLFYGLVRWFS
ncbi:hypothetical protein [Hydrogenophaga sp. 2FB]|uniref:hypothetical protein n=1 Tax=Hydrogenophaga sp. 2FB TaxID=2502187 RepID=UPI0010F7AAE2|nr:hypothetical protein [Hydrogenophaga sp. 2FB]